MAIRSKWSCRPSGPQFRGLRTASIPIVTFGVIGISLLLLAAFWAWSSYRFMGRAQRAEGRVVRIHFEETRRTDRRDNSSGPSYCPVVRFTTAGEKTVEFTGLGSSESEYRPGDRVTVLYLSERPEQGKIASFQELWLGPVVFAVFGALFGGVGLLMAKLKF